MRISRTTTLGGIGIVPFLLTGCFDIESNITFQPDGSGVVTARIVMDEGVEDAVKAAVEIDALEPEPKLQQFKVGLCAGLIAKPSDPALPVPDLPASLRVRELRDGDKLICEVSDTVPDIAKAMQNPITMSIWSVNTAGGQTTVSFNPDAIPDLSIFADAMLMGFAQETISKSSKAGAPPTDPQKLAVLFRRGITGSVSAFFSGKTVTLSVSGRSVRDTSGKLSTDNRTASYVVPTGQLLNAVLGQKKRPLPAFRAVVQP